MFHRAIDLKYLDGTNLAVTFQDGTVKKYDLRMLFEKYPQLRALEDRNLFLSGRLMDPYGIIWTDDLDLEVETIYQDGITTGHVNVPNHASAAKAVASARANAGISQKELAERSGIDQSDISKIERGIANPSISTLERIARGLNGRLSISIESQGEMDF